MESRSGELDSGFKNRKVSQSWYALPVKNALNINNQSRRTPNSVGTEVRKENTGAQKIGLSFQGSANSRPIANWFSLSLLCSV